MYGCDTGGYVKLLDMQYEYGAGCGADPAHAAGPDSSPAAAK